MEKLISVLLMFANGKICVFLNVLALAIYQWFSTGFRQCSPGLPQFTISSKLIVQVNWFK